MNADPPAILAEPAPPRFNPDLAAEGERLVASQRALWFARDMERVATDAVLDTIADWRNATGAERLACASRGLECFSGWKARHRRTGEQFRLMIGRPA